MKVAFYTLGCKTNQFETQAMERLFEQRGHEIVDFEEIADVYIVNTCTVTALSDKKSRNAARRCKKRNPAATLIVCGCYSQSAPQEARELCGADIVVGTDGKGTIVDLAEGTLSAPPSFEPAQREERQFELLPAGGLRGRTRALLKVQDGCQNFCSYCIIPYARGRCRSIPLDQAAAQAAELESQGYCEIVVTGIEVSSYGLDLPGRPSPAALLAAVCRAAPQTRIRVGSLEPRTITPEFLQTVASLPNLCPHFHLSLQSGCDSTLKRMNRKYTTDRYAQSVEWLRQAFPGCAVTTDLIVGFPGETEQDFQQSLDFVRRQALAQIHVFPYSRRKGTPAYSMPDQISQEEKKERARLAGMAAASLRRSFLESKLGQTLSVLFERPKHGFFTGFSPEYCDVQVLAEKGVDLRNQVRQVFIIGCGMGYLTGRLNETNEPISSDI